MIINSIRKTKSESKIYIKHFHRTEISVLKEKIEKVSLESPSNQNETLDEDKNYVDNKNITENGMDGKALENTLRQCNSAVEAFKDANDKYKLAGMDNDYLVLFFF